VAECRLFYRALLQKRPIILRSLLIVATPQQTTLHLPCRRLRGGRISSLSYGSFAKETYNFKEPTNRNHPTLDSSASTMSQATRFLRLVGSLQLYVSFAEYCLFYRALLQQRHIILRSLLIVATPYDVLYDL